MQLAIICPRAIDFYVTKLQEQSLPVALMWANARFMHGTACPHAAPCAPPHCPSPLKRPANLLPNPFLLAGSTHHSRRASCAMQLSARGLGSKSKGKNRDSHDDVSDSVNIFRPRGWRSDTAQGMVGSARTSADPVAASSEAAAKAQQGAAPAATTSPPPPPHRPPSAGALAAKAQSHPPTRIRRSAFPTDITSLGAQFSYGMMLVDKPAGWTSFDVCGKLRTSLKPLRISKVGHAGTLDPAATGLLVVVTGRATKLADYYQAQEKVYSGTIRLGQGTPSYDADTEVCERLPWSHITDADLAAAAARMVGDSMQVPPMYSARKVGGKKLCDLARIGKTVEREARPVTITSFRVWREPATRAAAESAMPLSPTATAIPSPADPSLPAQAQAATTATHPDTTTHTPPQHSTHHPTTESPNTPLAPQPDMQPPPSRPSTQDVHFEVACSKGTYVRTLAYDLGRALGTVAHLCALRRESIGEFSVGDAWGVEELVGRIQAVTGVEGSRAGGNSSREGWRSSMVKNWGMALS